MINTDKEFVVEYPELYPELKEMIEASSNFRKKLIDIVKEVDNGTK